MALTAYSDEALALIADRFRVLAEPARLRLLHALMQEELSVTDLVDRTGMGQANVSKHLGVLRSADFVRRRKDGLFAFYSIQDPNIEQLCTLICDRLEIGADHRKEVFGAQSA